MDFNRWTLPLGSSGALKPPSYVEDSESTMKHDLLPLLDSQINETRTNREKHFTGKTSFYITVPLKWNVLKLIYIHQANLSKINLTNANANANHI